MTGDELYKSMQGRTYDVVFRKIFDLLADALNRIEALETRRPARELAQRMGIVPTACTCNTAAESAITCPIHGGSR